MKTRIALCLLILLVNVWVAMTIRRLDRLPYQGFFTKYDVSATRSLEGRLDVVRRNDLSPGYLFLMECAKRAGLGLRVVRNLQLVALGASAILLALLAYRLAGVLAAGLAAALLLLSKGPVICASDLEPETFMLLFAVLALWLAMQRHWMAQLACGLSLAMVCALRPTGILLVAIIVIWRWSADEPPRMRRTAGLLIAAPALAFLIAYGAANAQRTGSASWMNPGTVFFEGWNSVATGYGSGYPRAIMHLTWALAERDAEPDAAHEAYRAVATVAGQGERNVRGTNSYWRTLAVRQMLESPGRALRLASHKFYFALHGFEAYDTEAMIRRHRDLRGLWIPFGILGALTIVTSCSSTSRDEWMLRLSALVLLVPLLVFYVTARQRNVLVPVVVLLASTGIARTVDSWARSRVRFVALACLAILLSLCLTMRTAAQREEDYAWTAQMAASEHVRRGMAAHRAGDLAEAREHAGLAGTYLSGRELPVGRELLREAAERELRWQQPPERRFDLAIALLQAGAGQRAEEILVALDHEGYVPRRPQATSSLSFYRALAKLRQSPSADVRDLLARAEKEAPGYASVLAARGEDAILLRLHDPLTIADARATVAKLSGSPGAVELEQERRRVFSEGLARVSGR